jgi:hypothetical protein
MRVTSGILETEALVHAVSCRYHLHSQSGTDAGLPLTELILCFTKIIIYH